MKKFLGLLLSSATAGLLMVAHPAHAFQTESATYVERATTDAVTDLGDKGDSVGDLLTFANEIYDEHNKNLLGHDNGWCIRTVVGKAWECFWTLTLADGQLSVAGPYFDAADSVLSVTGGTGRYYGARGEMKLHARNAQGTEYDFAYKFTH
ncbi:allene oxide cyclase family protein [Hypericibacter adhaerens]|nr:allene oxide cyclase family protein [Hypericibacter adhaerens]